MTKYNAILIRKFPAQDLKCGLTKYAAEFLVAINDNTHVIEIEASQLKRPMNANAGDEIIIDVTTASKYGNTYYNINPFTSYEKSDFPLIKQTYKTVLDEEGRDEISHKTFKEYPYRTVKICKTKKYCWSRTYVRTSAECNCCIPNIVAKTTYEIVEVDDEIDFTEIRNLDIDLKDLPLWTIKGEYDTEHLREALRDYLPAAEHPQKKSYSMTKIFQCYLYAGRGPANCINSTYRYGSNDNRCICGHYIEDVRWVRYVSPYPDGIELPLLGAIGNCCIKHFAVVTGLYTRLLADIVENYKAGNITMMRDISKKNGFGDLQMRLLERHVLTPDELKTLESALSDRTKTLLDNALKRILRHISEFYHKNYNYVFKEADEAMEFTQGP